MGCVNPECPLSQGIECPYAGNKKADIIYIGESPSFEDEKRNPPMPFIGPAGIKGREIAARAGLNWGDFFIMNSTRCRIDKRKLTDSEIRKSLIHCRKYVEKAINFIKPKCIVIAGDFALRQILGRKGILKARHEKWIWSEEFKCWCKPTFHPNYIIKNETVETDAISDFMDIKAFFNNNFEPVFKSIKTDYKEVQSIRDFIDCGKTVGFDTEGQGLFWIEKDYITICYQLSNATGTGAVIHLFHESTEDDYDIKIQCERVQGKVKVLQDVFVKKAENFEQKLDELLELWESDKVKKVMMNGNFDIHCVETLYKRERGIIPKIKAYTMDIQSAAHLLDDRLYTLTDLTTLQHNFTERQDNYNDDFGKKYPKGDMLAVPTNELTFYSVSDSDISLQVAKKMSAFFANEPRLKNYLSKFVMPTLGTLRTLEKNGLPINHDAIPKATAEVEKIMRDAQANALALVPKAVKDKHAEKNAKKEDGIILTRGDFISDIIYGEDGFKVKPFKFTKSKKPSTDVHARKEILEKTKSGKLKGFLTSLEEFSNYQHLWSTYFKGFEKHIKHDGGIHSHLSICKAATGRVNAAQPNVMNIPKRSKIALPFRKLIQAPVGYKILAFDQSQAELRWIAHCSDDPEMVRIYNTENADIHTETGKALTKNWDSLTNEEKKKKRQDSKAINFGLVFRMSAVGFVIYAKQQYGVIVNQQQAQEWINLFFGKYKEILTYHKKTIVFCKHNGYVESPLGRRRKLPEINSRDQAEIGRAEKQCVNFPIQASSSDTVLIACNQLLGLSPINQDTITHRADLLKKLQLLPLKDYGMLHPDECRPISFIHDELSFLVKDNSKLDDYARLIKWEMEHPPLERDFGVKLKIPLVVDAKIGDNSAEMSSYQF